MISLASLMSLALVLLKLQTKACLDIVLDKRQLIGYLGHQAAREY